MSIINPIANTMMFFVEHPFHSFSIMPHTCENVTPNAMSMQNEYVIIEGDSTKNPFANDNPKN